MTTPDVTPLDGQAIDHYLGDIFDAYDVAIKLYEKTSNPEVKKAMRLGVIASLDRALANLAPLGIRSTEVWEIHKRRMG